MTGPFEGIRVVDLSDRLSGAFAARLFGDFGADVVLAESPAGHPLRHEPPFLDDQPGVERSVLHAYVNWNKRSVVFEDAAQLRALVADADVVVTTASPVGERLSEVLSGLGADAVHLSVTPHGLDGPLAEMPGNNLTASARTGWAYINGYLDDRPLQMPRQQSGYVGGVAGFVAAAAALLRREATEECEQVDVSEAEAFALTVHPWSIAAIYEDIGWSRGPAGGKTRGEPGPLWKTADGQINFGLGDWHNWPQAMRLLNLPEFADREDLQSDVGRHSKDLTAVVAGAARELASMERWPLFHALAAIRCQSGVVQDIEDIVRDPQLAARDFLVETQIEGRAIRAAGAPAKVAPSPWRLDRPAPRLGDSEGSQERTPRTPSTRGELQPPSSEGPLAGIRVLSFGQAWSGTFGTELLSLLGADVVQIETLYRHDVWRRVRGNVPAGLVDPTRRQHPLNTQGLYNSVNLNKRAITLDLAQERGREMFWQMLPNFDVLADNFRPTVLPNWGMTLETLNEARPGIVYASISAYGSDGPLREYPGNGATTEPMSGLSSLHGYEGDPGMNTGGLYPDPVAGYFFAGSVLAALHQRDQTGEPQRVDLSMMEAVAVVCGDAIAEYDATGRVPRPIGNRHPRIAPHNIYEARDGEWLALAAESEDAWFALAQHLGRPELIEDARFSTMAARKANEAALDELLGAWVATQDAVEAERELGGIGVAAARVVPFYELYSRPDPNMAARGFIRPIDHPEAGTTLLPGRPWRFSAVEAAPLRPSPCVGQHSREVLREELGIGDEEYEALVAARITGTLDDLE
ncbi:MAG: CoA transferase [Chloroflexi bacterium]|nr:CoA transferase [Chloroflexota bacterium]MDA1147920.1 CoA transferase [Chloroflexota bacterium]